MKKNFLAGVLKSHARFFGYLLLLLVFIATGIPSVNAASVCNTTKQGNTSVEVCIDAPANNAVVSGVVSVNMSVTVSGSSTGIAKIITYLDGAYLLTDYNSPYFFELPTTYFADANRQLSVEAYLRNGLVTERTSIRLRFRNGISQPPVNNRSFTPHTGSPVTGQPFIVAATGDGASGEWPQVTDMIDAWNPDMFLYLGDVYDKGTYTEFYNWYGTSTRYFGKFRDVTNPVIGNHEYEGGQAPGYFYYWDNIPHYYSFNSAGWHFVALDSTSQFDQREPGTPQYQWLAQDLANNSSGCTIVFMHHPMFNIGDQGISSGMENLWPLLVQHGVDVVLTGHDHTYQRWRPLDANGNVNPTGPTQFVLGAGGPGVRPFVRTDSRVVTGYDTSPHALGSLRMELYPDRMTYQYINYNNAVLDSGSVSCAAAGLPQFKNPPVTGTNTLRPTFHFTSPANATMLQIVVVQNGTAVWNQKFSREAACGSPTSTNCQLTVPHNLREGITYEVYLHAENESGSTTAPGSPGGIPGWQGPVSFTLNVPNSSLPSNLVLALDNVDPIFRWNNDPKASWYQLVVKDLTTNTVKLNQWYSKSAMSCSSTTCSIEPGLTLLNHVYTWWVRSWGEGGFSQGGINGYAQGETINLTTMAPPHTPDRSSFVAFGDQVHTVPDQRSYQWNDVPRASWFELVVTNASRQIIYRKWFSHSAACASGMCRVGPDGNVNPGLMLNNGQYFWSVRAWGPGGFSSWAQAASFTIPAS